MPWYLPLILIAAFAIGAGFGVLGMALLAISKLGDDPLPEIEPDRFPRFQD